jgi:hypothetical protein
MVPRKDDAMQAAFRGINGRILLLPVVALVALAAVGVVSVHTLRAVTLQEHQARARVATEAATRIVEAFVAKAAKAAKGEMSQQAAQETAKDVFRAQRAAAETGGIAANVPTAAAALSREAERLRSEVEDFLAGVRAA